MLGQLTGRFQRPTLSLAVLGCTVALFFSLFSIASAAKAEASSISVADPARSGTSIYARSLVDDSGPLTEACVTLWRGNPVPFYDWQWVPVAQNCVDLRGWAPRISFAANDDCYPGIYYAEASAMQGSEVVLSDTSRRVETACG